MIFKGKGIFSMKQKHIFFGRWVWKSDFNGIKHEKHFSKKIIHKCGGEAIPRPFSKKSKLRIENQNQKSKLIFGK